MNEDSNSGVLSIKTLNHEAHDAFWAAIDSDTMRYPDYESFFKRYTGTFKIPRGYEVYTVENLQALAYMRYNPLFRKRDLVSIVADGLAYVYRERPEWYYRSERHNIDVPRFVKNFYLEEMRKGLKILDGAIAVSPLVKKHLSKIFDGEIAVCPPAVPEEKIKHLEKVEASDKNTIFSIVSNSEWKGLDILLGAFKIAKNEVDNLQLNLKVGDNLYQKHREELDGEDDINLFRDWYEVEEYAELFSESQIYVHSAYFDPHPVTVSEAMIAGLIPVVTDKVGTKHLFEDEYPELVRDVSAEDLASGIVKQLNQSEEEKRSKSQALRKQAEQVYPDQVGEKFEESLDSVLDNEEESL